MPLHFVDTKTSGGSSAENESFYFVGKQCGDRSNTQFHLCDSVTLNENASFKRNTE